MSGRQCQNWSCFGPTPFPQLPLANNPVVIFVSIQAEKSPWFIHRSHVQRMAFYKPGLWLSDGHIGQLCVIARHRMPLKANIYCICLLVIERLWCLSPASQSQAPPLYLPKIYSSIDSSTSLPYRLPSSKPKETSQVKGIGGWERVGVVFLHFAALNTKFQLKLHSIKSQWAVVTL